MRCAAQGAEVGEVSIPLWRDGLAMFLPYIGHLFADTFRSEGQGTSHLGAYDVDAMAAFAAHAPRRGRLLPPQVKAWLVADRHVHERWAGVPYARLHNARLALRRDVTAALGEWDVLLTPTLPLTAPKLATGDASFAEVSGRTVGAALLQHGAAQPHRPSGALGAERGGRRRAADRGAARRCALRRAHGVPRRVRARASTRPVIWSAHLSALFRELPYLERPRAAAAEGFTAVETWWPVDGLGPAWAAETARLGLDVSLVNCFGGDLERGDRGFLNVPERRGEALRAFSAALDLAGRCDAGAINVLVGRDTGDLPREAQLAFAADTLALCVPLAEAAGVTILIEALNAHDVPGSLLPTPAAAAELVGSIGSPCVRLLYDAYHAAASGSDPVREVARLLPLIEHVQFADCPGRGAPGSGYLDLDAFVGALEGAGYEGAVGLEFFADGPTRDWLGFMGA